jgi:protein-tyrosine phosphatase
MGGMAPRVGPEASAPFRICFVCTGNICRSPMAEVVFRDLASRHGLEGALRISSAGTGDWHVGEQADARTLATLAEHGYDGARHRARQFDAAWFDDLDLVVAFDRSHRRALTAMARDDVDLAKVHLLLEFAPDAQASLDVPDPYYSDRSMFDRVLVQIEQACRGLFAQIEPALHKGAA